MTARRYRIHSLRETRTFVVRNIDGEDVARDIETITEAWLIHEGLERADAERIAARHAALSQAAKVRALRSRSAFMMRAEAVLM